MLYSNAILRGHVEVKQPGDDKGKDHTSEQEVEEPMALPEVSSTLAYA